MKCGRDHPRLRGEYDTIIIRHQHIVGSPPLTRGIPHRVGLLGMFSRITPAYAGNTVPLSCGTAIKGDHPRLRGEYYEIKERKLKAEGSPPLTRGILIYIAFHCGYSGITPAYAGNTYARMQMARRKRDHPRLRGEYALSYFAVSSVPGSPPLTRGIRDLRNDLNRCAGITPAYAGNTRTT